MSQHAGPRLRRRNAVRSRAAVPPRHVDAIVNAHASGVGDPVRALSKIVALLEDAGARARGTITGSPEELAAALERAEGRRVLLAGGDGSLHAVANLDAAARGLPELALLPAGRANNLARALGVPTHWRAAIRLAVRGEAKPLDALDVRTPDRSLVAVEGVSAGFHASARTLYEGENSGDLSAGVGAFARAFRHFAPVEMRLTVDGYVVEDGLVAQAFLSNAPLFAYGFRVDPIARVDDGMLEAIVLHAEHPPRDAVAHARRARRPPPRAPRRRLVPRGRGAARRRRAARGRRGAARRDHRDRPGAARAAERGAAVIRFLAAFSAVAVGLGAARALTTAYVPVLLDEIEHNPGLIGAVMLVNAVAGFVVPLGAGWWSDRRGSRAPFILGGVVIAGGGLAAIALGTASSYLALALAAAAVYVGLNAATTAHRALVAERFEDEARPRATGSQEIAMLLGALVGTVGGGVLIESSPALLFAVARGDRAAARAAHPRAADRPPAGPRRAAAEPAAPRAHSLGRDVLRAARTPGAREVLAAQVLWVFAYVALAPFMVLYAEDVLGLGAAAAGLLLAAFGLLTGAGMLAAGALKPEQVRPALRAGTLALGAGLLLAMPASGIALAAAPFALAAVGGGRRDRARVPLLRAVHPRRRGGRVLRRVLQRARDRERRGTAHRGRARRGHRLLPGAARHGRDRGPRGDPALARGGLGPARAPRSPPRPLGAARRDARVGAAAGDRHRPARRPSASRCRSSRAPTSSSSARSTGSEPGPQWIYDVLDPHSRNYAIIARDRARRGAVLPPRSLRRGRGRRRAARRVRVGRASSSRSRSCSTARGPRRRSAPRPASSRAGPGRTSRATRAATSW